MRCRMVGRWSVPKTAAAVANSGAATRVVAVAVKWRTWAMMAARILRTAPIRPGMGRGLVGGCVFGAVWVTGMVVADLVERSKNFMMGFLMRGYVGWGGLAGAATIRDGGTGVSIEPRNDRCLPMWVAATSKPGLQLDTQWRVRLDKPRTQKFGHVPLRR